jgi:hydrogenase expression/formation protein HypD
MRTRPEAAKKPSKRRDGSPARAELARFSGDTRLATALLARVNRLVETAQASSLNLMEVCGTHTMAISSSGVRRAIDPRLRLISGPGCPVCVTAQEDIDLAIELARVPGITITTFGDMVRVPGSDSSLEQEAARGADVRIVYSPLDAVKLAQGNPRRSVVFLGVGFETTIPTVAAAVKIARAAKVENFLVLPLFKTMPQALRMIAGAPQVKVDAFILPGHVSTIIGSKPYEFLVREFHKPCCIVGFELLDLLQGISMLLEQIGQATSHKPQATSLRLPTRLHHREHGEHGEPGIPNSDSSVTSVSSVVDSSGVTIQYRRSVTQSGNRTAQALIREVFRPCNAVWRGLGQIPDSGLEFSPGFARFDARSKFKTKAKPARAIKGCRCGDVLLGAITPPDCRMFARVCTPENPLGPCMVSSEGACAAYYKYER